MQPTESSGRVGSVLKVSVLMVALLFVSAPAFAKSPGHTNNGHHHTRTNYDPEIMQTVMDACNIGGSVSYCSGGYNASQTFGSALPLGDVVTLTATFAPENASSATISFSDSLGNTVSVESEQCAPTTPVLCSAVAYFLVTVGGVDDIRFTVTGASGCLHFTAEDWYAANSASLQPLGTGGYCGPACTTTLATTPIVFATAPNETIAVSAFEAIFNSSLTSWTSSLPFFMYSNDAFSSGGCSLLFQATNSTATIFDFNSTTSVAPTAFAGSAEVLYV
ncbi:MAG: hypothetical protein JRN08_07485 [Nitrososphaerota archaeon]|nr:hypothetical protein [Nitrososphaerota archaeon]